MRAMAEQVRLHKVMAERGAGSRRACEEMIRQGRVEVNGETVSEMGLKVDPETDEIRLDREILDGIPPRTWVALHKPTGVVTTVKDPHGRRTVLDMLPRDLVGRRLVPVGRLDMDSEGLLLLTNDGGLVYGLTHPRHGVDKVYKLCVDKPFIDSDLKSMREGVDLVEGRTAPARILEVGGTPAGSEIVISIHEGKKRQLRRMCATLGYDVTRLVRVAFGPVSLDLPPGKWRHLSESEVQSLESAIAPRG